MKYLGIQICLLHRLIFEFFGNYDIFFTIVWILRKIYVYVQSLCVITSKFLAISPRLNHHSFKSLNIIVRRRDDKTDTANYEIYDRDYLKLYLDNEIAKNVECTIPSRRSVFFFFVK